MKAEVAQQRALLDVAGLDGELNRLAHRGARLPEQQRHGELERRRRAGADRLAALAISLGDLDAEIAKLESEVEAVRRREDRDRGLLHSGAVSDSRQLSDLQRELDTLERRQASLEDSLLEVMERREQLGADHAAGRAGLDGVEAELAAAREALDAALAGVEQSRAQAAARRADIAAGIDAGLLDLYERQRAASGIGAARLLGGRCGACRIELDRGELSRISAAPDDEVLRCPECRAILLRFPGS